MVRKSRNAVDGCEILHHQTDGWNPLNHGINDLTNGARSLPSTLWLLLCHGLSCVGFNKSQLLVANIWVVYRVVQFIINSYVYIFYTSTSVLNRGPTILPRVMYHWQFRMYWMHAQAPPTHLYNANLKHQLRSNVILNHYICRYWYMLVGRTKLSWVARADIEHHLSQRAVLHGPVGF